jgi:hypothetical protein
MKGPTPFAMFPLVREERPQFLTDSPRGNDTRVEMKKGLMLERERAIKVERKNMAGKD